MGLNAEFVTSRYSTFQLCHLQSKSVYLVCPSSYRKKKSRIKRHWGLVTRNNLGGLAFEWSLECEISNSSERNNENGQVNAVRDQGLATHRDRQHGGYRAHSCRGAPEAAAGG